MRAPLLTWPSIILLAAFAQLLVCASMSAFSRKQMPKEGLRRAEVILLLSSAVVIVTSLLIVRLRSGPPVAVTSRVSASKGSCAAVAAGMTSADVERRLGTAAKQIDDAANRGPGATVWIYETPPCIVRMLDGQVEMVD